MPIEVKAYWVDVVTKREGFLNEQWGTIKLGPVTDLAIYSQGLEVGQRHKLILWIGLKGSTVAQSNVPKITVAEWRELVRNVNKAIKAAGG